MGEIQNCLKQTFEKSHMESGPSNMVTIHVAFIKPGPIGDFRKNNYHGIRSFKNGPNM